jgi:predicted peptidase
VLNNLRRNLCLLFVACVLAAASHAEECPVPTGFVNKITTIDGVTRRHVTYVPHDYDASKPWPLIVFLHGAGERGDDGLLQTEVGLPTAIRRTPSRFPAIAVFPQCPADKFWDSILPELDAIIAQAESEYTIDPKRIYLTGLSMGGYGCWTWGADHVDKFAAILPICGGGVPEDMNRITATPIDVAKFKPLKERVAALATVPVWAFHGKKDDVVPSFRTKQMFRMIQRANGNVQYKEYEEEGHDVWNAVYGDEKIIQWMFEQRKP